MSVAIKKTEIESAYNIVKEGGLIVCPTKVGYILVGNTEAALLRKFDLKQRPLKKSAVVLTNYENLFTVAQVPAEHQAFIDRIEESEYLCGFICERREEAFESLDEKAREMSQQPDGTSCFVINHGAYSEYLVERAVEDNSHILASSANPSGTGNRGQFEKIGERILNGVDMAIEHDAYVAQRYEPDSGEQGVMVSFMTEKPTIIRKGLNTEEIEAILADVYGEDGYEVQHGMHP